MPGITIRLFGKLNAWRGDQPIEGLAARKVQELLAYLLMYRRRTHAREALAALLWGEVSTAQSKSYLRKALWMLQSALASRADDLLLVDAEWVQINPAAELWLDVDRFELSYALVSDMPGDALDDTALCTMEEAVDLYTGDLLDGSYQEWCLYERERLQMVYLALLDKLMAACEVRGRYEQGISYSAAILRLDSAREQTYRRLMRLHYLAGDRTLALRQYDRCAAALQRELAVAPTETTTALYRRIRDNQPLDNLALQAHIPRSALLSRLQHIQTALDAFHQQVNEELAITIDSLSAPVD